MNVQKDAYFETADEGSDLPMVLSPKRRRGSTGIRKHPLPVDIDPGTAELGSDYDGWFFEGGG